MKDPEVSYEDLVHLGTIWKLSAEIYAYCILCNLTDTTALGFDPPPIHVFVAEYTLLERRNDQLIRCLLWPTFIVGAASSRPDHRAWVRKTLEKIWHVGHCFNTRNASMVLESLWEKCDQKAMQSVGAYTNQEDQEFSRQEYVEWNWISELSKMRGSWLFI